MEKIKIMRCYFPFVSNTVKRQMAYRGAFLIRLLSRFFTMFVTYNLWKAIYSSSPSSSIQGFDFMEMTTYIVFNLFTSLITGVGGPIALNIANDVSDGSISMQLIRPINYKSIKMAENLGSLIVNVVLQVIPFVLIFSIMGFMRINSIINIFLFLLSAFLGFLCMFYFGFCFGMFSFYTTYFFGFNMAMTVLLQFFSGGLIPLTFFPKTIEQILLLLPFASINYTPIMICLGKINGKEIIFALGLQVLWVCIFALISKLLWNAAIKKLTILGG